MEPARQEGAESPSKTDLVPQTGQDNLKVNEPASLNRILNDASGLDYNAGEFGEWSFAGFRGVMQAEQFDGDVGASNDTSLNSMPVLFAPDIQLAPIAPTEQTGLDLAIRSFFANLDDMGKEAATALTQFHVPAWLLSVAGFTMVAELTRRRTRSQRQGPSLGDDDQLTISTWYPALLGMTTTD
jgi:hypothetical protein